MFVFASFGEWPRVSYASFVLIQPARTRGSFMQIPPSLLPHNHTNKYQKVNRLHLHNLITQHATPRPFQPTPQDLKQFLLEQAA
jgi:hypothetical protein